MKVLPALLLTVVSLSLQSQAQRLTQIYDASALNPPAGAQVAIVEFADLQCPACAQTNPLLMAAAAQYHIPCIRHDFPLPMHHWSFQAAINARWFDTQSLEWGNQYRNAVYLNQRNIATLADLRAATEKFASDRKLSLPFVMDPLNKIAKAVQADADLAKRIGIHETPTIFVVANSASPSYVQLTDRSQLYNLIDRALATSPKTSNGGK